MHIPLTQPCPQCEADMELITTDDDGEIVVYECPDCGFQAEHQVTAEAADDDPGQDGDGAPDDAGRPDPEAAEEDDAVASFEPDEGP
jgi:Zn ribbon nucleic-acid-binding protein